MLRHFSPAFNYIWVAGLGSLLELQLGFKGELTMSAPMEALMNSLYMEKIPPYWAKLAFPSRETARRVCGSS